MGTVCQADRPRSSVYGIESLRGHHQNTASGRSVAIPPGADDVEVGAGSEGVARFVPAIPGQRDEAGLGRCWPKASNATTTETIDVDGEWCGSRQITGEVSAVATYGVG